MVPPPPVETPAAHRDPRSGGAADGRSVAPRASVGRAVTLMLMTLVLPGSAQLVAGNKRLGRVVVRVYLALVALVVAVVLLGLLVNSFVFWLLTKSVVLGLVRVLLMVLAVGWAYLFVDAWKLGDPLHLRRRRQRLAVVGINGVLCFSVAGSLLFASHVVGVQKDFMSAMFADGKTSGATHGRYNVLLLGGDSGADRWGLRPDSISVASIDADTGKTVIFGLPRNMLNFPFPKGSIMAEQFPSGYNCGDTCELNSLATWAGDHKSLFKGVADPAVEATKEGVEGVTGLKINYWAMVNLQGFQNLVDAVGGVELNVRDRIPIGGVGAPITGYVPAGKHRLNGFQTLWFARSRVAADDYSRMARQKCVMNAMLHQLSPQTVVLKFEDIAKASESLISTDLPRGEVDTFMELALKSRQHPIRTVSFVPPMINTSEPDVAKIHRTVQRAISRSDGTAKRRTAAPSGTATPGAPTGGATGAAGADQATTGGSIGNMQDGYAANQSDDLSSSC